MTDRKKYPKFMSPRGKAIYPKLHAPDTKWKKEGEYSTKLLLDPNDAAVIEFKAKLEAIRDAFVEEKSKELRPAQRKTLKVRPVFQPELDDDGEETGMVIIKASMRASGIAKKDGKAWERKPSIFDAKGVKLQRVPRIGGGSELKLAGEVGTYYIPKDNECGITLYLSAVQVLVLKEFSGGGSAKDFGFEAEEEGFSADAEAEPFGEDGDTETAGDGTSGADF